MYYNCCSSCVWLIPASLDRVRRVPRSCGCDMLSDVFGISVGGFPTGIDIIHCDYHTMPSMWCGDVMIQAKDKSCVSYIINSLRDSKHVRIPPLFDNSQNIKIHSNEQIRCKEKTSECSF